MKKSFLYLAFYILLPTQLLAQMIPENIKQNIQDRIDNAYSVGIIVGVAKNNQIEYYSYGYTDLPKKYPINEKTAFEIGSISKTFTALLLAEAVSQSKVNLDEPIQKYLPNTVKVPSKNNKVITLRHLATHTSGLPRLPDNLDLSNYENPYQTYDAPKLYDFLNTHQLKNEPGKRYEYSNLGYGLLGHILELLNQKTYSELINQKIAKPLKMKQIGVDFVDDESRVALPHSQEQLIKPWSFGVMAGAGALKTNAEDMLTYLQAQMQSNSLQKALELTHQINKKIENDLEIGLGWHIWTKKEKKVIWHNGGTGGSRSYAAFDPIEKKSVIVLSNSDFEIDEIGEALIFDYQELSPIKKKLKIAPEILQSYVGKYQLAPNFIFTINYQAGKLIAQLAEQSALEVFAESENKFFYTQVDAQLEFIRDAQGKVIALILHQNGRQQKAEKIK